MRSIVRWCLKNKSVVFLGTLLLIGSGLFATTRLNQELLPNVDFPVILVSTPVPGAGPNVVDEQVSQPVEGAVTGVEGIEGVQTTSSQGFSVVALEFGLDVDTEEVESEVQSALEGLALPPQAVEPEVIRQSASQFPMPSTSLSRPGMATSPASPPMPATRSFRCSKTWKASGASSSLVGQKIK